MTDKPNPSSKTRKKRVFPIRNFARLLDEFLKASELGGSAAVETLKDAVDAALLEHYKR